MHVAVLALAIVVLLEQHRAPIRRMNDSSVVKIPATSARRFTSLFGRSSGVGRVQLGALLAHRRTCEGCRLAAPCPKDRCGLEPVNAKPLIVPAKEFDQQHIW